MSKVQSIQNLREELSKFSDPRDRLLKLKEATGWPEDKALDLLNFMFQKPVLVDSTKSVNGSESVKAILEAKYKKTMERKAAGEIQFTERKQVQLSQYELDRRHNRYLLGIRSAVEEGQEPSRFSGFDEASFDHPEFRENQLVRDLRAYYGRGQAKPLLLLCGGTGEGKTFISLAWANRLAKVERDFLGNIQSTNVKFITAYDLTMLIAGKKFSDIEDYRTAGILILDDVGGEPTGYKGADFSAELNAIVTYRDFHRKPTLITTNHNAALLKTPDGQQVPGFFEVYGERIRSRFHKSGVVLTAAEGDMRRK
jgi:DNA replication protein DnaC